MTLPPQSKALLSVDFTAVEEINYQHIFEQMLDDCGLDSNGHPSRLNWELDDRVADKMKKWLGIFVLAVVKLITSTVATVLLSSRRWELAKWP